MNKCSTETVIGMDMSDKKSEICVLDVNGEVKKRDKVINDKVINTIDGMNSFFSNYPDPSKVLIDMIAKLSEKIKTYDNKIKMLSDEEFPETKIFSKIAGVGPITALSYILIIEAPVHFRKSRDIGPFLGLTPRRDQSGEVDKQLGITKAGNELLRRLLVQCAQYILGAFGPDCDLRRAGEKIASRGGSGAKKQATIAVARKLGVLMHHLWATGEEYNPFYNTNKIKYLNITGFTGTQ
jgi:Transposase IS116/IS110/IS902 family